MADSVYCTRMWSTEMLVHFQRFEEDDDWFFAPLPNESKSQRMEITIFLRLGINAAPRPPKSWRREQSAYLEPHELRWSDFSLSSLLK